MSELSLITFNEQKKQLIGNAIAEVSNGNSREVEELKQMLIQMNIQLNSLQNKVQAVGENTEKTIDIASNIQQTTDKIDSNLGQLSGDVQTGIRKMLKAIDNVGAKSSILNCSESAYHMFQCILNFLKMIAILIYYLATIANNCRASRLIKRVPFNIMNIINILSWVLAIFEMAFFIIVLQLVCVQLKLPKGMVIRLMGDCIELFANGYLYLIRNIQPLLEIYVSLFQEVSKRESIKTISNSLTNAGSLFVQNSVNAIGESVSAKIKEDTTNMITNNTITNTAANVGASTMELINTGITLGDSAMTTTITALGSTMDTTITALGSITDNVWSLLGIKGGRKYRGGEGEELELVPKGLKLVEGVSMTRLQPILNQCILLNSIGNAFLALCILPILNNTNNQTITGGLRTYINRKTHRKRRKTCRKQTHIHRKTHYKRKIRK